MSTCRSGLSALIVVLNLGLAACGSASKPAEEAAPPGSKNGPALPPGAVVDVFAQTQPVAGAQPNDAAFWIHPVDASKSLVLAASGEGGLELFDLAGQRVGGLASAQLEYVDVAVGFALGSSTSGGGGMGGALVVGYDTKEGALAAFTIDPHSLNIASVSAGPLKIGAEASGLCTYRSPRTGRHYAFVPTDDGYVQQWELYEKGGKVAGGIARTLPFGAGAGYCAVDERNGTLFVTEETVGIWKLAAEPESDAGRELVDVVGIRGRLAEEVKGIAFHPEGEEGYLLAADVAARRINVYSTSNSVYRGSFLLRLPGEVQPLKETEGLAATATTLGLPLPGGAIAIADQNADTGAMSLRLVKWNVVARDLHLTSRGSKPSNAAATANVMPTVETEPVDDYGDAADDPAIWVHPTNPAQSLIIGAQKKRGLYVYDLAGKTLQVLPDGRMNNVDLRQGFRLGSASVAIVAASNRTSRTLALYKVDAAARRLSPVAAEPIPTGFNDPYGLCMYRSAKTGDFYVFMNDAESGAYKQWRLAAKGDKVVAEVVREFTVGSQAEGCAADDDTGALYVAEEDVGLWRYDAEPTGADKRTALDDTTDKGHLTADVEGVAIYFGASGKGYLIVSNQGKDNYAVYRREGANEFIGHFSVIADSARGIDGASETDGLDVTSAPLGAAFPHGLFVAQDGRNIAPTERQNFKLVPWERVVEAMGLTK